MWSIRNGLDCQTCTPPLREFRGHDKDTTEKNVLGYRVKRCPMLVMTQTHRDYLQCYADFQKGILPNPGGSLQQPMKLFQVINTIEKVLTMCDKEES